MALSQTKHTVEFSNNTHTPSAHPTRRPNSIRGDRRPFRGNSSRVSHSPTPVKPGEPLPTLARPQLAEPVLLVPAPLPGGSDKVTRAATKVLIAWSRPISDRPHPEPARPRAETPNRQPHGLTHWTLARPGASGSGARPGSDLDLRAGHLPPALNESQSTWKRGARLRQFR